MSASFRKYERITRKRDFKRVYTQGKKCISDSFILYIYLDQTRQYRRLGISVSKKNVSHAVTRNWCKRMTRELFRRNKEKFPLGADVVVVIRQAMVGRRYAELAEELLRMLPDIDP